MTENETTNSVPTPAPKNGWWSENGDLIISAALFLGGSILAMSGQRNIQGELEKKHEKKKERQLAAAAEKREEAETNFVEGEIESITAD